MFSAEAEVGGERGVIGGGLDGGEVAGVGLEGEVGHVVLGLGGCWVGEDLPFRTGKG